MSKLDWRRAKKVELITDETPNRSIVGYLGEVSTKKRAKSTNKRSYNSPNVNYENSYSNGQSNNVLCSMGIERVVYDYYGFDKDGYNKAGLDIDGYDRSGFNRRGYNRHGLHRVEHEAQLKEATEILRDCLEFFQIVKDAPPETHHYLRKAEQLEDIFNA